MRSGATDQSLPSLLVSARAPRVSEGPRVSTTELSDEDVLRRVEAGDYAAVEILFDRYSNVIFGIGLRVLRDRGEAEDLVQEVCLSFFEKVKGFDPSKGSGRIWIVQIAYRRAFDRRAYLTRRKFYLGTDIAHVKNTLRGELDSEQQLADLLTGEQLHEAFEELSETQRATLEMYFFRGLDLRAISEQLGETLENTRHFYYRGLERLRRSAVVQASR